MSTIFVNLQNKRKSTCYILYILWNKKVELEWVWVYISSHHLNMLYTHFQSFDTEQRQG